MIGIGIDFANADHTRQRMNDAADAAVLAAVSQAAANAAGGYSNTTSLQDYGLKMFQSDVSGMTVSTTPELTVTPNSTGGDVANLTYTANVPTFFAGVLGFDTIPISGHATASASPVVYINYYIIVDISQSMGIGATETDMQNLYNRSQAAGNTTDGEPGCVFACHVPLNGQSQSVEYLAHNVSPTITLRIDSAIAAIQSIIRAAQTSAGANQNIKLGLYTMSQDPIAPYPLLNTISPLSSNYSALSAAAPTIDLGDSTAGGPGDSNFSSQLNAFRTNILGPNGTGASPSSPLNYVFIITDGVADTPGPCTDGHCTAAFDSSLCDFIKTSATVGVIYTTYLPIYFSNNASNGFDPAYSALVAPFAANIAPALQSCASSSAFYYEASDGPSITTGMNALFASSERAVRLTQ